MMHRNLIQALTLVSLLLLAPLAAAQSPASATRLALKGYDPVAYFTDAKPTAGKPEYETEFERTRYRFASAEHLSMFKADPARYAPQFSGSCAAGVSMGVKVEAEPENWLIVDGKLFVFSGPSGPAEMRGKPTMISAAREQWQTLRDRPFN
jgi:hypothetical protein